MGQEVASKPNEKRFLLCFRALKPNAVFSLKIVVLWSYYCLFFFFLSFFHLNRDGIPPYKQGTKKQLQREMNRSVKINGQVSLPHFPVRSFRSLFPLPSEISDSRRWQLGPLPPKWEHCFYFFKLVF